jgi:dTDP-4-amino-4,6-dideoxygalactose transaminase
MHPASQESASRTPAQPVTGVPLFDVQQQYGELEADIQAALSRVCASGRFVMGPDCEQLETAMAKYCGAAHAIGCASGSDALLLALLALGIGRGHEVIVPSFTFFATAGAVWQAGATPIFADIDPHTYNLDPDKLEGLITPATKAMIPVHLYGQCAEMDAINRVAKKHSLAVVEDAAQAIGAAYKGCRAGTLGDIGCLSFYPTKNLGCFGDGGMLTTNNDELAERLRLLRTHGMKPRYFHKVVGINSRLDSIQAAVLNVKLPHLDRWVDMRSTNAARYHKLFAACGLDKVLTLPATAPDRRHVWNQYIVRVPYGRRDELRAHLASKKIGTEIYYPLPLHKQECFQKLPSAAVFLPHVERAANETLALPIFPELTAAQQELVVSEIGAFYNVGAASEGSTLKGPKFLSQPQNVRTGGF